jgi:hypothetical protein
MAERRPVSPSDPIDADLLPDREVDLPPFVANGVPPLEEGPDPFDPARLRLHPDFSVADGVGKVLKVGVRKPAKEWFIRVHPDPQYALATKMIELKSEGGLYLVHPDLLPELEALGESTLAPKRLYFTVNRQSDYFFWPVAYHDPLSGRKEDEWTRSARLAAERAKQEWVRVFANQRMGYYDLLASSHPVDPVWPTHTLGELLRRAFGDLFIDSWDHLVLRSLRP